MRTLLCLTIGLLLTTSLQAQSGKSYRLPAVDLKQQIVWGSEATSPAGYRLLFGGLDQQSPMGTPHTHVVRKGQRTNISAELQHKNPLAKLPRLHLTARLEQLDRVYRQRYLADTSQDLPALEKQLHDLRNDVRSLTLSLEEAKPKYAPYEQGQIEHALKVLAEITKLLPSQLPSLSPNVAGCFGKARHLGQKFEDLLGSEPPARALSPVVFDPHTKLFVVFAGDHLDYLSNDLWVFDPQQERWQQRHPIKSSAPRANHTWKVLPEGRLELRGGYTYTSNTDYMGGQYRDLNDGVWIYDITRNQWTGEQPLADTDQRVFRTGALHPDFYLTGKHPKRQTFQAWLDELPANTWRATNPPHQPQLNRDWGTAVLDPKSRQILRFSGGHCAHGGTDVLHYSLATNRWLLADPVEFPLGQLYTNTEYPHGVSFNGRPWITGHTYQNYALRARGELVFTGQPELAFHYQTDLLHWNPVGIRKPAGMDYGDCFYTLTLATTPAGIACWTQQGRVFFLAEGESEWKEWQLTGDTLPGSSVDNSTLVYDSKRDQLLFYRKDYGDEHRYDGIVHALNVKTKEVTKLRPDNAAAAYKIPYLCQLRYDEANDLILVGGTLPPDDAGERRTPAYDPAANRWISLRITGDDPSGAKGRNVSLGLMYDPTSKRFWATDTYSQVYVLRLDLSSADPQPLR